MALDDEAPKQGVDPEEFLRALLKISPEDAEEVREETPATRKRGRGSQATVRNDKDDEAPGQ